MMHYNNDYHYWGMHFVWWAIWIIFLIWIFATPYKIPGKRAQKETPLDVLKKRFAVGEISKEEYQEKKDLLKK
ncbi:SHOCT domain-containing protein [uncultured Flavobacterium sp.]|uniref:SHOCT domain-containing protein n=1 Tax=uncultured Flavobacterium sp. TaxID=165435 RepID=UPI0030EC27A0